MESSKFTIHRTRRQRFLALLVFAGFLACDPALHAAKAPLAPVMVKSKLQAIGVKKGVDIRLADGTTRSGKLLTINDESFTLQHGKEVFDQSYEGITRVKKVNHHVGLIVTGCTLGAAGGAAAAILPGQIDQIQKQINSAGSASAHR